MKFFKDFNGIKEQMKKHAALLRPNFETVENALERDLGGLEIGSWDMPRGGYFIHFESLNGCANEIVKMAKEAGLVMTEAGATYPYHKDPNDSSIRIAPSMSTPQELEKASEIFTLCVRIASINKLLAERA